MTGYVYATKHEPGGRAPAPGELHTLQLFVNTHNIEAGVDLFARPESISSWLLENKLTTVAPSVTTVTDVARVIALRETLRDLLTHEASSATYRSDPGHVLRETAAAGHFSVSVGDDFELQIVSTADGLDGALARLVLIAVEASSTGQWRRLKVCPNDECRWAFWDSSRNRSGRWCTMSLCGNQAKVRAHRQRTNP